MGWFFVGLFLLWWGLGDWIGFAASTGIVVGGFLVLAGLFKIADEQRRY